MADVHNYYIGKGVAYWKGETDLDYRDLGNAPKFELNPKVKNLDHWSSRLGTKFKDFSVVIEKEATVSLQLDEWTEANLALVLLGSTVGSLVNIMDLSNLRGSLKFVGANNVGPKKIMILPSVNLFPNGKLDLISNDWGEFELQGEVLGDAVTGSFGTIDDVV